MSRLLAYTLLGLAAVGAAVVLALFIFSHLPLSESEKIFAAYREDREYGGLTISYPLDETLFPREIVPPTFRWNDSQSDSDAWLVTIKFQDGKERIDSCLRAMKWTPSDEQWEAIKRRSLERAATVTVLGVNHATPEIILSAAKISISTSKDEVGAPLFYREVVLPFIDAVRDPSRLRWRFGEISSRQPPPVVLENLPVCGNCHSFSADGSVLGMDVDYANSKGSYVIDSVAEEMVFHTSKIFTWDDYKKEEGELSFGLLSQISPDGKYTMSTVKDRSVFVPKPGLAFSQLFFPIKGILAYYCRETQTFHALPGADDRRFVHSNASWSPDGKYIVFARSKVHRLQNLRDEGAVLLSPEECREFLEERKTFLFDLYRIPFNRGKGGTAEPLEGASNNGKSNYFARYSPDGKWIVFCKAKSFMLLQPDSELYIIPAAGGKARRLRCNTSRMNSWHSWSPNGKWLVFSSKANTPYTQLFLTHIDEQGRSTPAVLLSHLTAPDRAANIPEFVNARPDAIKRIDEQFLDDYSFHRAGIEFTKHGDWDGAARAFRKVLEVNPNHADAHGNLGISLSNIGMLDEARIHLAKAVELDPGNNEYHRNLGILLCRQREYEEAITHYREALRIDPQFVNAHISLASALLATRKTDQAIEQYQKALSIEPGNASANFELARILLRRKELAQAEEHLAAAIKSDPNVATFHYHMGRSLHAGGQVEQAVNYYRRAIELDPDMLPAVNALAWIYSTSSNDQLRNGYQGVILATRACQPPNRLLPHTLDTLAAAYAETGQFTQAVETARKALLLAEQAGNRGLADQIRSHLKLYLAGKPFRGPPP